VSRKAGSLGIGVQGSSKRQTLGRTVATPLCLRASRASRSDAESDFPERGFVIAR
jgi:hypothetical protein